MYAYQNKQSRIWNMETPATDIFKSERKQAAEIDRLRAISLSHFRFENTWLKVESSLLPSLEYGEIYICSNKDIKREIKAKNKHAITYGPAELKRIIELDPGTETMKQIHAAKAVLGGRVIETTRRGERE